MFFGDDGPAAYLEGRRRRWAAWNRAGRPLLRDPLSGLWWNWPWHVYFVAFTINALFWSVWPWDTYVTLLGAMGRAVNGVGAGFLLVIWVWMMRVRKETRHILRRTLARTRVSARKWERQMADFDGWRAQAEVKLQKGHPGEGEVEDDEPRRGIDT